MEIYSNYRKCMGTCERTSSKKAIFCCNPKVIFRRKAKKTLFLYGVLTCLAKTFWVFQNCSIRVFQSRRFTLHSHPKADPNTTPVETNDVAFQGNPTFWKLLGNHPFPYSSLARTHSFGRYCVTYQKRFNISLF